MLIVPGNVALVEYDLGSMEASIYETRLDMVKAIMDNGKIGAVKTGDFQTCYGGEKHLAALDAIEQHAKSVRDNIAKHNAAEHEKER